MASVRQHVGEFLKAASEHEGVVGDHELTVAALHKAKGDTDLAEAHEAKAAQHHGHKEFLAAQVQECAKAVEAEEVAKAVEAEALRKRNNDLVPIPGISSLTPDNPHGNFRAIPRTGQPIPGVNKTAVAPEFQKVFSVDDDLDETRTAS